MGGIFLLSGLLAAIVSAPLLDRVLIHHLAKTVKIALPILSVAWICLIFVGGQRFLFIHEVFAHSGPVFSLSWCVVKPNNLGGIYVVLVAISSVSFILLPVGLELGVEITHNAETSTAILWSGGNTVSVLWVLGQRTFFHPFSCVWLTDSSPFLSSDERAAGRARRKPTTEHEASADFQLGIYCGDDVAVDSIYRRADEAKVRRANGKGCDWWCADEEYRDANDGRLVSSTVLAEVCELRSSLASCLLVNGTGYSPCSRIQFYLSMLIVESDSRRSSMIMNVHECRLSIIRTILVKKTIHKGIMIHYWRFCAPLFTLSAPSSTLAAASFLDWSAFEEPQSSHELLFSLALSTVSSAVCCRNGVKLEGIGEKKEWANLGGIIGRRNVGLGLFVLVNDYVLALLVLLRRIRFCALVFLLSLGL